MLVQYKFYLTIDNVTREAHPLYEDNLSLNTEQESGEMLFRTKLDGKLKFVKSDYDFIMSAPFDSVVYVRITREINAAAANINIFSGKFVRTDCTIIADDKILETKLEAVDSYKDILEGLDKEYNLIELAPEIQPLYLYKRPAVQVYVADSGILTTFIGGTYFEQEATQPDNLDNLVNKLHFYLEAYIAEVTLHSFSDATDAEGLYIGKKQGQSFNGEFFNEAGTYKIVFGQAEDSLDRFTVVRLSDNTELFAWSNTRSFPPNTMHELDGVSMSYMQTGIYARLLHDKSEAPEGLDVDIFDIPTDDIVENNCNYKKCSGINLNDAALLISTELSNTPTEWGIYQPGQYYARPYSPTTNAIYPVGRNAWLKASIWIDASQIDIFGLTNLKWQEPYRLKHTYPILSCIEVLLKEVCPTCKGVTSEFFTASPNPISKLDFSVFITPKSNVLKGEYDQAAQKAMIKLSTLLDMLKNCFQCFWYMNGDYMQIEHISYFQKGGSYENIGLGPDLTELYSRGAKKPWSYGQSEYSYEKEDMPERYEFEWSDDATFPFKGYPIEVKSNYVKKGNTENITVSDFSSDVDLMLLNPDGFSNDGFALLIAEKYDIRTAPSLSNIITVASNNTSRQFSVNTEMLDLVASDYNQSRVKVFLTYSLIRPAQFNFIAYDNNGVRLTSINIETSGNNRYSDILLLLPPKTALFAIQNLSTTAALSLRIHSFTLLGVETLPLISKTIDKVDYVMQNGYAAFCDLQEKYYKQSLPASKAVINKVEITNILPTRRKKQDIEIPSLRDGLFMQISPYKLIRTSIGDGQVKDMKINLSSGLTKITLMHDTE